MKFCERYAEEAEDRRPVVGTVYIDKYELPKPFPEKIRVTIEPAQWLNHQPLVRGPAGNGESLGTQNVEQVAWSRRTGYTSPPWNARVTTLSRSRLQRRNSTGSRCSLLRALGCCR
jgi:hypothetical protein